MATPVPTRPKLESFNADADSTTTSKTTPAAPTTLLAKLASALPKGHKFGVYHLSTPPTRTDALCSAPPGERPDKTYWENHFLAISIDVPIDATVGAKRAVPGAEQPKESNSRVFILALEVFIFSTAYSTTLFVSKADSTGYLHLLKLPKGTPSPIREVTTIFVAHLIEHRQRPGVQFVISLFARAQDQYLFPLSVENKGKHVLDDRGLVKWWCRVLDPMMRMPNLGTWDSVKGYLIVPGLEQNETRFFLPRTSPPGANWVLGHPMESISHYTKEFDWVPPRCLIPRYPDDPKSRFRDELDEESLASAEATGRWNSVRSLDQFWEMMAFRQECSSGRLTGFIWVVFDPPAAEGSGEQTPLPADVSSNEQLATPTASFEGRVPPETPPRRRASVLDSSPIKVNLTPHTTTSSPSKLTIAEAQEEKPARKKRLTGRIVPRLPRVKRKVDFNKLPSSTPFYHWPAEGRGEVVVNSSDYKRIVEMLLHLSFKTLSNASTSTARWISQVDTDGNWGHQVVGSMPMPALTAANGSSANAVTDLTSLIRKKPRPDGTPSGGSEAPQVNVLGAGLVRKKPRPEATPSSAPDAPQVNVLDAGLVRKKPRTA